MYDELRTDEVLPVSKEWDWTFRKRPGPWEGEPDKSHWYDAVTGLPCLAVRGPFGAWCGYVGVHPGHPLYRAAYPDAGDLEVHGGLTYADACTGNICHVAQPGEPPVWWLGFDCAHAWDLVPAMAYSQIPDVTYRTLEYVRDECASLAWQLDDMCPAPAWRAADRARTELGRGAILVTILLAVAWLGCAAWLVFEVVT